MDVNRQIILTLQQAGIDLRTPNLATSLFAIARHARLLGVLEGISIVELSPGSVENVKAALARKAGVSVDALRCLDCGMPYSEFPLDTHLSRSQWLEIHHDESGVLCANCIVARIAERIDGAVLVHLIAEVVPHRRLPVDRAMAERLTESMDDPGLRYAADTARRLSALAHDEFVADKVMPRYVATDPSGQMTFVHDRRRGSDHDRRKINMTGAYGPLRRVKERRRGDRIDATPHQDRPGTVTVPGVAEWKDPAHTTFVRESPDDELSSRRRGSAGNFEEMNDEVVGRPQRRAHVVAQGEYVTRSDGAVIKLMEPVRAVVVQPGSRRGQDAAQVLHQGQTAADVKKGDQGAAGMEGARVSHAAPESGRDDGQSRGTAETGK
jgi:hypothetical protein